MMKDVLLTWALFVGIFTLHAGFVFETVETADKLKDKDLTFAVTFDRGTVNADYAKGDPLSTTMREVSLLLRGTIGFDGKPGFNPSPVKTLTSTLARQCKSTSGDAIPWICTRATIRTTVKSEATSLCCIWSFSRGTAD